MALITTARAIEQVANFPSADNQIMTDIVQACSDVVEKYCNRTFASTSYDELYDGTGFPNILLNQYPLMSVDRVMFNPTSVLSIGNAKSTVSRANFRLDSTSLYLTSVASGVTSNRTITLSSCPTLADLAAAVNTYSADGWTATALGIYSTWSTSDLFAPQGGQEVRWVGYGYLWHHTFGVPLIKQNTDIGELVSWFPFTRGYQNYRIVYTAGFPQIPTPVQQACAELSAAVYLNRETNPNLASENLTGYTYSAIAEKTFANLSQAAKEGLSQYKNHRVSKYRVYG